MFDSVVIRDWGLVKYCLIQGSGIFTATLDGTSLRGYHEGHEEYEGHKDVSVPLWPVIVR